MFSTDPFTCAPVCRLLIAIESITAQIGPAGDAIYVPLRVVGGHVDGLGGTRRIVGGSDLAVMHADETLVHNGVCFVSDPAGDIIIWFEGPSQFEEGAYDGLLEGILLPKAPSRLAVRFASTNVEWRTLNRRPLLGVGSMDGDKNLLDIVVLTLVEQGSLN